MTENTSEQNCKGRDRPFSVPGDQMKVLIRAFYKKLFLANVYLLVET